MKDYLRDLVRGTPDGLRARLMVREYLQARLLQHMQEAGAFTTWAFLGGTCLRFLFNMARFSEDLDFALIDGAADDRFRAMMLAIKAACAAETYRVRVTLNERKTVRSAFVMFPGLFHELGLSPHRDEALSIKVEIDTRPPAGAHTAVSLVRRHVLLSLLHYDQASLLSGKLHALLARAYTKGRDVYDLVWYLSDRSWPAPNLPLLNNALKQTHWPGRPLTATSWRTVLQRKLATLDWARVAADVRPFVERPADVALLTHSHVMALLGAHQQRDMHTRNSR